MRNLCLFALKRQNHAYDMKKFVKMLDVNIIELIFKVLTSHPFLKWEIALNAAVGHLARLSN